MMDVSRWPPFSLPPVTGSRQTSPFSKYGPALQSSFVARGLSYVKIALTKIGHFFRGPYFSGCDAVFPMWFSGLVPLGFGDSRGGGVGREEGRYREEERMGKNGRLLARMVRLWACLRMGTEYVLEALFLKVVGIKVRL